MARSTPADLKPLTALRFFAALWVVLYDYWPSLTGGLPRGIAQGYLGVELFFVLSGFILTHVYLDRAAEERLHYAGFLWARLARIYPLHLATIAVLAAMGVAAAAAGYVIEHPVVVWSNLPQNLLLIQAWGAGGGGWNHPSWSISAEWFAYLTFPAFAWAALRLRERPRAAVFGVLILGALLYAGFERVEHFPLTRATLRWGALRIVPCFALGCAVNLLARKLPAARPVEAAILAGLCALAVAATAILDAPDPLLVALFGALILQLARLSASGSRLLTAPALVYLGEVSFAVYMVCFPWSLAFTKGLGLVTPVGDRLAPALWALQLIGVLPAAMALHHLIERPARRWMRAHDPFARNPTRTPAPEPVI